ncbi:hypothetical protein SAY86_001331 [Trapa natans]|uniref:Uncharacterized protein n=1 Tax=Trapa natans TaxID=22666 RepID=A0AAN7M5B7_TRANT|nr:hypothetical protein SAY86_001331 [Trapa natans]
MLVLVAAMPMLMPSTDFYAVRFEVGALVAAYPKWRENFAFSLFIHFAEAFSYLTFHPHQPNCRRRDLLVFQIPLTALSSTSLSQAVVDCKTKFRDPWFDAAAPAAAWRNPGRERRAGGQRLVTCIC